MDKTLQEAAFNLYLWQQGNATNFTAMLFELIAKADGSNKQKLRRGFPTEVLIFQEWQDAKTSREFFTKYRVSGAFEKVLSNAE